jgi:hypothetical protein
MSLLTLPRELRFQIYSYLTTPEPISYPFRFSSPITSISHQPPPSALQRTCHLLHSEIRSYFYAPATIRCVQKSFKPIQHEKNLDDVSLHVIQCAKKVEIVFLWNRNTKLAHLHERDWQWRFKRWLEELVFVLLGEGKSLEVVIVSVWEQGSEKAEWDVRTKMLAPLEDLRGRVKIVCGVVSGWYLADELRGWLEREMEKLNHGAA